MPIRTLSAAAMLLCLSAVCLAQTKLLRFPDVSGDRVVFTYAGDLWTASVNGGTATRLTAHPGTETYAKFSPDGNGSLLRASTMETSRYTLFRLPVASRSS